MTNRISDTYNFKKRYIILFGNITTPFKSDKLQCLITLKHRLEPLAIKRKPTAKKKEKKRKISTWRKEREILKEKRDRNRETEIERRAPPRSSTISVSLYSLPDYLNRYQ